MQSVLDGVSLGAAHRAEGYDPAVVEGNYNLEKEVHVAARWVLVEMHVTDWALLVAWDDQPDVTSQQKLHKLSTA